MFIGSANDIKDKYNRRYFPAEDRYILEYSPALNADLVLETK